MRGNFFGLWLFDFLKEDWKKEIDGGIWRSVWKALFLE